MMSFVLTTSDGGVFLIDGGYSFDVPRLLKYLKEVCKNDKPHIDAIWLTHPHSDHIWAFVEMIKNHRDEFSFDKVYYHFGSEEYLKNDPDVWLLKEYNNVLYTFSEKTSFVEIGDRFDIKGATFEVLYVTDETINNDVCNNSSTVFTIKINDKKILILGDCGAIASELIATKYGNYLSCDYVQMAHHGQSAATRRIYELSKPKIGCFWPTPLWLWNNDNGKGYNTHTWTTIETRNWMDEISPNRVDYVEKDGMQIVNL